MRSILIALASLSVCTTAVLACGDAGTSGTPYFAGSGSSAGSGGAGSGGSAGSAGDSGTAGTAGDGGESGSAGEGGTAGSAGDGGAAGDSGSGGNSGSAGSAPQPECVVGELSCDGLIPRACDASGHWVLGDACPTMCHDDTGCVECIPNTGSCQGQVATRCRADGSGYDVVECDADIGLACIEGEGRCDGACSPAKLQRSYIGCEYFPTVTSNGGLFQGFSYAAVVANTTSETALVTVKRNGVLVKSAQIASGATQTIELPWVPELINDYTSTNNASSMKSVLSLGGAYRLTSTQPVTVYQFNPLEFQLSPAPSGCSLSSGKCNSFTNDASLLLPSSSQGNEFVVASSPTLVVGSTQLPGFVSITATKDGTTVSFKSSAYVRAGTNVSAMTPGETQTFTLNRGDVVQLLSANAPAAAQSNCITHSTSLSKLCKVSKEYDLTGSIVTSNLPVQVIGGHDCSFMPYNQYACDHLEESLFPTSTLGQEVIITAPQAASGAASNNGAADKQLIRVISAEDNNVVSLDPPLFPGGTLNKGQYADIPLSNTDLVVKGTGKILVAQYMLGGDVVDPGNAGTNKSKGDPSLSVGIPSAQYRTSYQFLAPSTYTYNFVNIIVPQGAEVKLDGAAISGTFTPIGSSNYRVLRKAISGGAHTIESDQGVGIVVYGYGAYTSYMYPGGLNLNAL